MLAQRVLNSWSHLISHETDLGGEWNLHCFSLNTAESLLSRKRGKNQGHIRSERRYGVTDSDLPVPDAADTDF